MTHCLTSSASSSSDWKWVAPRLEQSPLSVAWPVVLGLLFQVALGAIHVLVWALRGAVWPVRCDYPVPARGRKPCSNPTLGEWHRCYLHRRAWQRRTDRHVVDPDLRRWQTIKQGARVDRDDIRGGGFLCSRSRSIGILYYHGFACWPRDVRGLLPQLYRDYRQRLAELQAQYRQRRTRIPPAQQATTAQRSGVSGATFIAREATKLVLTMFAGGLLCVAIALIARLHAPEEVALRVTDEYAAALFFFFTASIVKNGVWGVRAGGAMAPRADWLDQARTEIVGSYVVMILLAWLGGTIGRSLGEIQDTVPRAVVVGAVVLLLLSRPKPKRRRRRAW